MHRIFEAEGFKGGLITAMDPRLKLIVAAAAILMAISHKGFIFPVVLFTLSVTASLAIGLKLRTFLRRFAEPLFITAVLVMIKMFQPGGDVLFRINLPWLEISGHMDGLVGGLLIASRIFAAVAVVTVLSASTPFAELMSGLSWLRAPKVFIEVMMFAYRYIFVLFDEAEVIYNAQKNRLGYAGIRRGLGSFGILSGALVLKAFDNSRRTTTAMVQRGYDGNVHVAENGPFRISEVMAAIAVVIMLGVIWKI